MADKWNIIFSRGARYEQVVTIEGYSGIENATNWTLRCAMPNAAAFIEATVANGMIVAGATANQKVIRIPAATTATFPRGNGRFDLELTFPNSVTDRIVSNQQCEVVPKVGEVP